MNIDYGLYKIVFIFKKLVIKIPRLSWGYIISSILEVYTEKLYWVFCNKKHRKYLLPCIYIPILPIVIQPRVQIVTDPEVVDNFSNEIEEEFGEISDFMSDIKADNLGYYKGKVVKIDYGFPYIFYNIFITIKNKIRRS